MASMIEKSRFPKWVHDDSVEIGLDDFGVNLEDVAVGWIDDYPQPVDLGRTGRVRCA